MKNQPKHLNREEHLHTTYPCTFPCNPCTMQYIVKNRTGPGIDPL